MDEALAQLVGAHLCGMKEAAPIPRPLPPAMGLRPARGLPLSSENRLSGDDSLAAAAPPAEGGRSPRGEPARCTVLSNPQPCAHLVRMPRMRTFKDSQCRLAQCQ